MMSSLFSIFDPSSFVFGKMKWAILAFSLFLISWQFWALSLGSVNQLFRSLTLYTYSSIKESVGGSAKKAKQMAVFLASLFMIIFSLGFVSLVPSVFTATAHMAVNLSFALPLWLIGMIFAFAKSLKSALAHFVPTGSPSALIPFLILIETVSSLIRPMTLSVRLMANMMAGHLILCLASQAASNLEFLGLISVSFLQSFLLIFEAGVAVVQAYVFMGLMNLYWNEA
nr:ATP synthase F0 subunit 6 [Oxylipeurus chiniri]